ncbi:hypothetical protein C8J34_105203 [Rhizobium sp. PP-F2F-G36]|nr:hypothetical protein C8J34_105203 [Rhizobium sp. PP-F2F-G36]
MNNEVVKALTEQAYHIVKNEAARRKDEPKASGKLTATPVTALDLGDIPPRPQTDARQWAKLAAMALEKQEWTDLAYDESLNVAADGQLDPVSFMERLFEGTRLRDGSLIIA